MKGCKEYSGHSLIDPFLENNLCSIIHGNYDEVPFFYMFVISKSEEGSLYATLYSDLHLNILLLLLII